MPHPNPASNPISTFLGHAHLGTCQSHKALSLWPLLWPATAPPSGPECIPLREALAAGLATIDEVSDGGSVPHVRVTNKGKQPVLFLFGEEIVGAKQNRVANATFLVPAQSTEVIDVSCVEAGRWQRSPREGFRESKEVVSSSLRRKMAMKVSDSLARGRGFVADQGEVWDDIGERLSESRTASPTSAWADYRKSRARDVGEFRRAFRPVERQVGFVVMRGDRVVGLEAVGRSDVFAASHASLLAAYTIDAADDGLVQRQGSAAPQGPVFDAPEPFLAELANAPVRLSATRGLGSDLRVATERVAACALACEGLVHLTAFPTERPVGGGLVRADTCAA